MLKDPNFSYTTPDSTGYVPDFDLIDAIIRHTGNGHDYRVTGFAWLGATDEWGFIHRRAVDPASYPTLCRPISHLTGNRSDGTPRYEHIS